MKSNGVNRGLAWLSGLMLVHSLVFCFVKYFTPRSLWLDEAFVACNIRYRALPQLFSPLEYAQQFPRGYLALVWFLTKLIGYETGVLRLLPFLFGVGALLLWSKILWDEFESSPLLRTTAILAFLVNHVFYQYVGDFKQYTGDLFWAGFAVFFALKVLRPRVSGSILLWTLLCGVWALPIFLSNTYVLVLTATGAAFLFPARAGRHILIAMLMCAVFLGIAYAIDLRFAPPSMQDYWRSAFITGATPAAWLSSFLSANARLLGEWLLFRWRWVFVFFAYAGFIIGRRRDVSTIAGILTLELLVLAALRVYPIDGERLSLFFYPFAVIAVFNGIEFFISQRAVPLKAIGYVFLGIFLSWILFRKTPELSRQVYLGKHWEDINPAVSMLDARQSTQVIYGSASVAQVRAFPHLPEGFSYHAHPELDLRSDWLAGNFYYLMATPNEEPVRLAENLLKQNPHRVEPLDKHLFLFRAQSN
jgi:hypothetical protein